MTAPHIISGMKSVQISSVLRHGSIYPPVFWKSILGALNSHFHGATHPFTALHSMTAMINGCQLSSTFHTPKNQKLFCSVFPSYSALWGLQKCRESTVSQNQSPRTITHVISIPISPKYKQLVQSDNYLTRMIPGEVGGRAVGFLCSLFGSQECSFLFLREQL